MTVGIPQDTIVPYPTAFGAVDPLAIGDCLEGLVTEDAAGNAIAGQARSWTSSPDGLVYTFTLRDDLLWSDGERVIAQDFVAGFQFLFDPANALKQAYLHFFIENAEDVFNGAAGLETLGVVALDDRTVQITLEQPVPYFLEAMTHSSAYPLPSRHIETFGMSWLKPENVVCNGPFTIVDAAAGVTHSVKSPRYYDAGAVALESVDYLLIDDLDAGLARYERGEIDALYDLPNRAGAWIAQHRPDEARITPFTGLDYYVLNLEKPPFDNPDIRRALSMSIDRTRIDPDQFHAERAAALHIVPPGTANFEGIAPYLPDWASQPMDQRLAAARALLAGAGFGPDNPLTFTLRYNSLSDDRRQKVAQAVAGMWAEIGVNAQLLPSETSAHFDALYSGNFDVGRYTWLLDFSDPANILELNQTGDPFNAGRYANPAFDALMQKAAVEPDLGVRATVLAEAEKLLVDDAAVIPLAWVLVQNLISPRVSGVLENAKNVHRSRWITLLED